MQQLQRTTLMVMAVFLPILALLWFSVPWSISRADFELTGEALFEEVSERFSDPKAGPATWTENIAWLKSDEAMEIVFSQLSTRQIATLSETGNTWDVKLRERMRGLSCYGPFETWHLEGLTICSWLDEQLKPKSPIDQRKLVEERLSVVRSGDGQQIQVAFRAADRTIATAIVDAFGDTLLERQSASRREWRHRVVANIEADFEGLTREKTALETSLLDRENGTEDPENGHDAMLMAKFMDAMKRAREELSLTDRRRLSRELEAVKSMARDELLSETADPVPVNVTTDQDRTDTAAVAIGSLTLLSHPDWSKSPVVRLSETTSDGFSVWEILAMTLMASLIVGFGLSRCWPNPKRRFEQQNQFYASPYANPHWPNMRI